MRHVGVLQVSLTWLSFLQRSGGSLGDAVFAALWEPEPGKVELKREVFPPPSLALGWEKPQFYLFARRTLQKQRKTGMGP